MDFNFVDNIEFCTKRAFIWYISKESSVKINDYIVKMNIEDKWFIEEKSSENSEKKIQKNLLKT